MRTILLTHGKVALVDDEDFERLSRFKWHYKRNGSYAFRLPSKDIAREVLQTDKLVDHRDGNGLDNRKSNLRESTRSQNRQNNKKTRKLTSSKYKGVFFYHRDRNWRVGIRLSELFSKSFYKYLGSFPTEKEAAKAYDRAARHYFGEFACLNFPEDGERSCLGN